MMKRGEMYHHLIEMNKTLPKDKQLTVPKQINEESPEVVLYRSTLVEEKVVPKKETKK